MDAAAPTRAQLQSVFNQNFWPLMKAQYFGDLEKYFHEGKTDITSVGMDEIRAESGLGKTYPHGFEHTPSWLTHILLERKEDETIATLDAFFAQY